MNKQKGLAPLVIIILIAFAVGGYLIFQKQFKPAVIPQPSPTPSVSDETTNPDWKTHQDGKFGFEFKYPNTWYRSQYGQGDCVYFSDISNPQDIPSPIKPDKQNIIKVCIYGTAMPSSFPYTSGSDKNTTIKQYVLNGREGLQGKQTTVLGEEDVVMLRNPRGGYIELVRTLNGIEVFDQILSTFKFLP